MRKCNLTVARLIESPTAANTSGQVCLLSLQTYKELHLLFGPAAVPLHWNSLVAIALLHLC